MCKMWLFCTFLWETRLFCVCQYLVWKTEMKKSASTHHKLMCLKPECLLSLLSAGLEVVPFRRVTVNTLPRGETAVCMGRGVRGEIRCWGVLRHTLSQSCILYHTRVTCTTCRSERRTLHYNVLKNKLYKIHSRTGISETRSKVLRGFWCGFFF